jgi:hypothetical protein
MISAFKSAVNCLRFIKTKTDPVETLSLSLQKNL